MKLTLWLWRVTYIKVIFTICKKCSGETKGEEENRRYRGVGGKEERRGEKLRQRGRREKCWCKKKWRKEERGREWEGGRSRDVERSGRKGKRATKGTVNYLLQVFPVTTYVWQVEVTKLFPFS